MATRIPQVSIDPSRLFRFQSPMLPNRSVSQQYVVGNMIDGELWLLTTSHPPQLEPVSDLDQKFQVFVLGEVGDMQNLIAIWHHTSKFHIQPLSLYSLKDLGVDLSP